MDQARKGWFAASQSSEALYDHDEEETDEELKSARISLCVLLPFAVILVTLFRLVVLPSHSKVYHLCFPLCETLTSSKVLTDQRATIYLDFY
jgi:type II secretory pathway component PulF